MADQFQYKYILDFGLPVSFYSGDASSMGFKVPYRENKDPARPVYQTMNIPFESGIRASEKIDTYYAPVGKGNIPYANGLAPNTSLNPLDSFANIAPKGVRMTDHHITFSIEVSKDNGNPSKITLYNISDDTRGYLESKQGDKIAITLKAGYVTDSELPVIFNGEIINVLDKFEGVNRITELVCSSGSSSIQEAYTVRTFKAGTKVSEIFDSVMADLKLPKGTVYYPKGNNFVIETIQKPIVVSAPAYEVFKKLSKTFEYSAWIENGTVNVLPKHYVLKQGEFIFKISNQTGMIGSPTATNNEVDATEKTNGTRMAVQVTTTLNGAYTIGGKVALESKFHNGVYEIVTVTHNGSYEGGQWSSSLDLKPVDGYEIRKDT